MNTCEVKIGFFVLAECGNEAIGNCQSCNKAVCAQHSKEIEQKLYCVECLAETPNNALRYKAYTSDFDALDRETWTIYSRISFYRKKNFEPFDESDYEGFEIEGVPVFDEDFAGGAFFDS